MIPASPIAHTRRLGTLLAACLAATALAACGDDNPSGLDNQPKTECTTDITAANGDGFVELCAVSAPVRHIRIEGARAAATHASAQLLLGFAATPTTTSGAVGAQQFRVLLYGGGTPAPSPVLQATWGSVDASVDEAATYINSGATVCFDIHDGSATTAPQFVIWVSGQRGANCSVRSTLTAATAMGARAYWRGTTGTVATTLKNYFRQSAGSGATPKITLSTTPVLEASAITAATVCSGAWTNNTDWQSLCAAPGGSARHVRIDNIQATANNSYFYAVFGQDAAPTGNPAASAGKLIITGGRSASGASWTWFRFGAAGTTTQFSYATDAGNALYTTGSTSICFDIGSTSTGTIRVIFWATGAKGADCATRSTLRADRALYDSSTDTATGTIWNAALIANKLNFIKTNNATVTIGNVTVSAETAVL
jgi:hypothetical protein